MNRLYLDSAFRNNYIFPRRKFAPGGSTSDNDLIEWIIREEGFNEVPKDIGDGKMTLGSGLTDPKWHALYRKRGNVWSKEDNRRAVAEEVAKRRTWATKNIPNWNNLSDSAQKALISYKYNYDFNAANSPKLFKALSAGNYQEAARQMDATSKDPKFRKGLKARREREQNWFMRDFNNAPKTTTSSVSEQIATTPDNYNYVFNDNTQNYNPYARGLSMTISTPVIIPDKKQYIKVNFGDRPGYNALRFLRNQRDINSLRNKWNWRTMPTPQRFYNYGNQ